MGIPNLNKAFLTQIATSAGPWAVALLAAVFIFLLLRRRWKKIAKKLPLPVGGPAAPKLKEPKINLVRLWRDFSGALPWKVRSYFGGMQFFIVLGEAGSGKSKLISDCTDWREQSDQMHPSNLSSPLAQFYLSSRAVVLEISSTLLADISRNANRALEKLGKALPRVRPPHVVLVINGSTLATRDPDSLRRLAGLMRGKISLLPKTGARSAAVSLALTHMDQMPGYSQWLSFLNREGLPMQAAWGAGASPSFMAKVLDRYEALLPRALTSVTASDYLSMLAFLRDAGNWLAVLEHFVAMLQSPEAFTRPPRVMRLTLHGQGQDKALAQPFLADLPHREGRIWTRVSRQQLLAGAMLTLGIFALGSLFIRQHDALKQLDAKLDALELARPAAYDAFHGLFPGPSAEGVLLATTPLFFSDVKDLWAGRLSEAIRRHYLYPELQRLRSQTGGNERLFYLLGLIYATPDNGLGSLVRARPEDWSENYQLPVGLVIDYATHNSGRPAMNKTVLQAASHRLQEPIKGQAQWAFFLRRMETACAEPFLSPEALRELKDAAQPLLQMALRIHSYPRLLEITAILKKIGVVTADTGWLEPWQALAEQEQLIELVKVVSASSLDYPEVGGLSLGSFLQLLESMPALVGPEPASQGLVADNQTYQVSLAAWRQLLRRSQTVLMMRSFVVLNAQNRGLIFFSGAPDFPDIRLNSSNDGTFLFTGQARIDGRLTRDAFEKRVRPVLETLDERLQALPLSLDEAGMFRQAVSRHVEWYADQYADAYRNYWRQFRIKVDSENSLRLVLNRILGFSSPFLDLLVTVHDNTCFETGDSPLFRPLRQQLEMFSFLRALMQNKDGLYPEWEKYKGLISQMTDILDGVSPMNPESKDEGQAFFQAVLSPLGRLSYAMQTKNSESILSFCRVWLRSAGIGREWERPFLEPFQYAQSLGADEMEYALATLWEELYGRHILPLRDGFPFSPESVRDLTPDELERVIGPDGAFWKDFRLYMAPVCRETNGVWAARDSSQAVKLPHAMIAVVNSLARISRMLWDDKGAPRPLVCNVQPPALPAGMGQGLAPVLAFLRIGPASAMAFNQQPSWQALRFDWWKIEPAAVGVVFGAPDSQKRVQRELTVDGVHWSFFRLLARARSVDKNVLGWTLETPWEESAVLSLEYRFSSDPWAALRLAAPGPSLVGGMIAPASD